MPKRIVAGCPSLGHLSWARKKGDDKRRVDEEHKKHPLVTEKSHCFIAGQRIVVLHVFVKKAQETPDKELRLARKRMKEVRNG
jgi:hypothetical protein